MEQIQSMMGDSQRLISLLTKSRAFYTGRGEQYGKQLSDLRAEYAQSEQRICGLIDSLGMTGESDAKRLVLKRVEELSQGNREIERRIHELEGLATVNMLSDGEFEQLRQRLPNFRTSLDAASVEEKRAAIRAIVKKVIWDGANAHLVLFGAEEAQRNAFSDVAHD
jgi:site-specific DNA recombinase